MLFWKGLTFRPVVTVLCVLLLAAVLFLQTLGFAMQSAVSAVNVETERVEIAMLRPDVLQVVKYDDLKKLYSQIDTCFDSRFVLDLRTFGGAYSEGLTPVYTDIAPGSSADLVILIGKCTKLEEPNTAKGKYCYTFDILETVYKGAWNSPDIKNVTYWDDTTKAQPLVEEGKTYLFWGHCVTRSDGTTAFKSSLWRIKGIEETVVQQGVKYLLHETETHSDRFVPLISELPGTLDEFLQTEVGKIWEETVFEKTKVADHSVSVIGTDCMKSIPAWVAGDCVLTAGEMFSQEQYESGERVCMISEELAEANGLSVGDTLPLSLYAAHMLQDINHVLYYNVTYDAQVGFAETSDFRIVGIYSTAGELESGYNIHPNTVFLPNAATTLLQEQCQTLGTTNALNVNRLAFSYVLPRNGWPEFDLQAEALGFSGWFVYWDSETDEEEIYQKRLQAAYDDWSKTVNKVTGYLPLGATLSVAALMLIFILSKKKEIGRLYDIRTPWLTLFWHMLLQGLILGAAALVLCLLVAVLLLPHLVPAMLHPLADPTLAEALIAELSVNRLPSVASLASMLPAVLVASLVCAFIGACRRYQFEYHEKE